MNDRISRYSNTVSYVTKDGSLIRELQHPDRQAARWQSLAEAILNSGQITALHVHAKTEELYHITHGQGEIYLNDESFEVRAGDSVCISPGVSHCIKNTGTEDLRFLCCCTPPYSHADTQLLGKR